jgi:hypothetical protein
MPTPRQNHAEDRPPIINAPGSDASVEEMAVWFDDIMSAEKGAPDSETARFVNEGIDALRPADKERSPSKEKSWKSRMGRLLCIILVAGVGFLFGQNSPAVVENPHIAGAIETLRSRAGLGSPNGEESMGFAFDLEALGDYAKPVRGKYYELRADASEVLRKRGWGISQSWSKIAGPQSKKAYSIENAYVLEGLETLEARVTRTAGGGITSSGQPYDPTALTVATNRELFDERDRLWLVNSLTNRAIEVTVNDHIRRGDIAVTPAVAKALGFEGKSNLFALRIPHEPVDRAKAGLVEVSMLNADLQPISGQSEMIEGSAVQGHAAGDTTLD